MDYVEIQDQKFSLQVLNFRDKIAGYKVLFGLTDDEVTAIKKDCEFVSFVILAKDYAADHYLKDWTALKDQVRKGVGGNVTGPFPTPVDLTSPPDTVDPNVEKRFRDFCQGLKTNPKYTTGIGQDLGIEASHPVFDPDTAKPIIKIKLVESGNPHLHVKKGDAQGWVFWKDSGTGWVKSDKILHPNYIDHDPLPAVGQSVTWRYKARYLYKDVLVGNESDIVSVTVFGGGA